MNKIDQAVALAAHAAHHTQEQERAHWEGVRLNIGESEAEVNALLALAAGYADADAHPYEDAMAVALYREQAEQYRNEMRRRYALRCALDR
jgi:hypothetical protein